MRNLRRNLDNDICYSYDGRSYLRYLFFTVHLGSPVVLWQEKHGKNYTNAGNGESKKDTKNLASKGTVDTKKLMV